MYIFKEKTKEDVHNHAHQLHNFDGNNT